MPKSPQIGPQNHGFFDCFLRSRNTRKHNVFRIDFVLISALSWHRKSLWGSVLLRPFSRPHTSLDLQYRQSTIQNAQSGFKDAWCSSQKHPLQFPKRPARPPRRLARPSRCYFWSTKRPIQHPSRLPRLPIRQILLLRRSIWSQHGIRDTQSKLPRRKEQTIKD